MGLLRMLIVTFSMMFLDIDRCNEVENGYFWVFLFLGFYGLIMYIRMIVLGFCKYNY